VEIYVGNGLKPYPTK